MQVIDSKYFTVRDPAIFLILICHTASDRYHTSGESTPRRSSHKSKDSIVDVVVYLKEYRKRRFMMRLCGVQPIVGLVQFLGAGCQGLRPKSNNAVYAGGQRGRSCIAIRRCEATRQHRTHADPSRSSVSCRARYANDRQVPLRASANLAHC